MDHLWRVITIGNRSAMLCIVVTIIFSVFAIFGSISTGFSQDTLLPSNSKHIRIASIYALSGVAANSNSPSIQGVRIGVKDINQRGGVLGKKIELLEFDNMSTPIGSKVAADHAVQDGVTAIIGAAWSSHSIAIAHVAQKAKIPMISNISTHPDLTKIGDYIFRICFTDLFQGKVMASFARRDLNAHTAVMLVDINSDFAIQLSEEFKTNFKRLNGKILAKLDYKQKQDDFDRLISQVKPLNPDVLFIPGYDESAVIIREALKAGLKAIPLGGDGWDSKSFLSKGGKSLKKAYYCTHWAADVTYANSKSYLKNHPDMQSVRAPEVLGVDAVSILADAITRAGSTDRAQIRQALANTKNFQGITGTISFNKNGDPIKSAVIMEITEGREHFLKAVKPD